jgi:hypothetical protein
VIRAFRKIREHYLKNNNSGRYLKYAIGEVILVVVGILLALQINSCKQEIVEAKAEKIYLKNLKVDLIKELNDIDIQLEFEQKQYNMVSGLLKDYYEDSDFTLDSVFFNSSSRLIGRKTFNKNDPTYTALLSTGDISLLKDDDFKNSLFEYYQKLEQLENILNNNNVFFVDQIYKPIILNNSYYYRQENGWNSRLYNTAKKQLEKDNIELLIVNSISQRAVISENNTKYLETLKNQTHIIIDMIDKILEK